MNIVLLGLNHRTAPLEMRERLAVTEKRLPEALVRLKKWPGIDEALILSTCNRVELYAVVRDTQQGLDSLRDYLLTIAPEVHHQQVASHAYSLDGQAAIRHLFRVAASLDSMVLGEPQILGQVKEAFETALTQKSTGAVLNKVVKKALSVGKRVRTETGIGENAVSVSYMAIELAKKIFQDLAGKTVLLVGAGEMAKLAARHLVSAGMQHVMITNRSYDRTLEVAKRFNAIPIPFGEFPQEMAAADIVISSTDATSYLIGPTEVQRALRSRGNRPMFLIDICVPRNIDPAVGLLDNAYLYHIDDLQGQVDQNVGQRRQEALKAEEIVSAELGLIVKWIKSLDVVPTIMALRRKAEAIQRTEVERVLARLGPVSARQRQLVEDLASAITNKLLHAPLVALKAETDSPNGTLFTEIAHRLFNLEKELETLSRAEAVDEAVAGAPPERSRDEVIP